MNEKTKQIVSVVGSYFKTYPGVFFLCFLIGLLVFVALYGFSVLNPQNIAWVLNGQDLEQHYMGWEFYRFSSWTLPIGQINSLAYPYGIPIAFTDSIPLVAIPLKLISAMLPESFQYMGLWGFLSFGLVAGFTGVIVRKFTTNLILIILATLIILFAPVLIARTFIHTALASVWLILASIALIVHWRNIVLKKWLGVALWSALLSVAILVHPYYFPMVSAALLVYITLAFRSKVYFLLELAIPILTSIFVFWVSGGLSLQGSGSLGTPNEYNMDMAAIISGSGWSSVIPKLEAVSGESMMFVGLGALLCILVALGVFIYKKDYRYTWSVAKRRPITSFIVATVILGLTILALGTVIRVNGVTLMSLEWIPDRIQELWGTFRASARLFWPIYYGLIIAAMCFLLFRFRRKTTILVVLFTVFAATQILDVTTSSAARSKVAIATRTEANRTADEQAVMKYIQSVSADGSKKHLFYLDSMEVDEYFDLNEAALSSGLTMNAGYFSRAPQELINQRIAAYQQKLFNGKKLDDDTIYVIDYPSTIEGASHNLYYKLIPVGRFVFLESVK